MGGRRPHRVGDTVGPALCPPRGSGQHRATGTPESFSRIEAGGCDKIGKSLPRKGEEALRRGLAVKRAAACPALPELSYYKTMPYSGAMRVVATSGYERRARKLLTAAERAVAELEVALDPLAWPVIAGTGGARKARAARGGKGKSGGARIIYYVVVRRGVLYLIDVHAKSAKEDLTDAEKKEIRKLTAALGAAH